MATGGRPVKRLHLEPDCAVQNKRGKKDHVKRKQNLTRRSVEHWTRALTALGKVN